MKNRRIRILYLDPHALTYRDRNYPDKGFGLQILITDPDYRSGLQIRITDPDYGPDYGPDYRSRIRIRIYNQNNLVHDGLKIDQDLPHSYATIFRATFCRIQNESLDDVIF